MQEQSASQRQGIASAIRRQAKSVEDAQAAPENNPSPDLLRDLADRLESGELRFRSHGHREVTVRSFVKIDDGTEEYTFGYIAIEDDEFFHEHDHGDGRIFGIDYDPVVRVAESRVDFRVIELDYKISPDEGAQAESPRS